MKISKILSSSIIAISFFGFSIGGMLYTNTHANANNNPSLNNLSGSNEAGTNSLATLKLTNGYLALDNVPNLNFGGTNDTSKSNTLSLNTSGLLRVTDYRNESSSNTISSPWELDVNMDQFRHDSDGNNNTTDKTWQMQLNNNQAAKNNGSNNSEQSDIPVTDYSKFNDDNTNTSVMVANNNSNKGYGTSSVNYNGNDVSLTVPSVKPDSYYTTMHWTLSANMNSQSNRDNSNDSNGSNNANNQANYDPNGSNNANKPQH